MRETKVERKENRNKAKKQVSAPANTHSPFIALHMGPYNDTSMQFIVM